MEKNKLTETIIALEKAALEEWNNGNPSPYLELYADDITYFDPAHERRIEGLDKMTKYYESVRGKIKIERYEILNPIVQAADNMAVLTYNLLSYANGKLSKWNCTEVYKLDANNQWRIIHNHWSPFNPDLQ